MKRNWKVLALALLIVFIGLFFFLRKDNSGGGKVRIGVILPFSGDLSSYGKPMKEGMMVFKDENKDVELFFEDSKGLQKDAVGALTKLINVDKVNYVIGDVVSQNTLSMIPLIENKSIFLLSPGASSPKLNNISKLFARNYPSSLDESTKSADFAISKGKKDAVIFYVNTEFGIGLNDFFSKQFLNGGGKVVQSISYEEGTKDFKNLISKLNSLEYDVLYLGGNQLEMGNFIKQFKQLIQHNNCMIISNISFLEKTCLDAAGENAAGVIVPTAYYNPVDSTNKGVIEFTKKYSLKYNSSPTIVNAVGYDAVSLIYSAIKGKGNSPQSVAEYIRNLKNFNGALGILNFYDGDVTFPMQFNIVNKDGTTEIIK